MMLFASVLMGMAVFALIWGIYLLLRKEMTQLQIPLEPSAPERDQPRHVIAPGWARWVEHLAITHRIDRQLEYARISMRASEWLLLWMGITAGSFLLGWLISRTLLGAVGLAFMGFLAPKWWLSRRIHKRRQMFQDQLTDVLRLITNALQAGHGLLQALHIVAEEMPPPAGEEFGRVVAEVGLGYSLVEALHHLAERIENDDLDMVVTAVEVQSEVGGSLAEILETVSRTIEDRIRLKGEIRTLTAQQRMSGYVISGMPFVLAVILTLLNPQYMMKLFTPGWRWLPALGVAMIVLGNVFIQRMMRIDV